MGSYHNLFGLPNEAQIFIEAPDRFHVAKIVSGSKIQDMVSFARYDVHHLHDQFAKRVRGMAVNGQTTSDAAEQLMRQYEAAATWSTYLD
jgi:arginine decarboxylase